MTIPPWLWIVLAVVSAIVLVVRVFYARFRAMCRGVRDQLTQLLAEEHPGIQVLREEMGNLVVRLADGRELIWEMADLYTAVAQLPGMGKDIAAREALYRRAVSLWLSPESESGGVAPGDAAGRVRPLLVPLSTLPDEKTETSPIYRVSEELGLATIYVQSGSTSAGALTQADSARMGLSADELHSLALDDLRRDFPCEMVAGVLAGTGATAIQLGDSFDAARLLLVPEQLAPGDELIALVPHRDLLVLLPAEMASDPTLLRQGIVQTKCDHPPLLERPVLVSRDGFRLL